LNRGTSGHNWLAPTKTPSNGIHITTAACASKAGPDETRKEPSFQNSTPFRGVSGFSGFLGTDERGLDSVSLRAAPALLASVSGLTR